MRHSELSSFGTRLRSLRLAVGLSQVELAQAIGRHQTAIGPYERDEYVPPRDVIERMAHILDTTAEYLFFGRNPQRSTISVAGIIADGGILNAFEGDHAGSQPAQPLVLREDQLIGYRVEDDLMAPVFRQGQVVLVAASAVDLAGQLGRDCLAQLHDGRTMLRRLMPAALSDRYDLLTYDGAALHDIEVVSVRPVWGTLSPEALSPT